MGMVILTIALLNIYLMYNLHFRLSRGLETFIQLCFLWSNPGVLPFTGFIIFIRNLTNSFRFFIKSIYCFKVITVLFLGIWYDHYYETYYSMQHRCFRVKEYYPVWYTLCYKKTPTMSYCIEVKILELVFIHMWEFVSIHLSIQLSNNI